MSFSQSKKQLNANPLIVPVYVPTFLMSLAAGIITPVLPIYLRSFGAGYGMVGLVLSGQAIGMLVSDLPNGMVLRRLGQRRAMIAGMGLIVLSTLVLYWTQTALQVLFFQFVSGVGLSIFSIARHDYLADKTEVIGRGRAIALFGGINRIGRFSGPAIGGLVGSAFSLRVPFLFTAGIFGLVFLIIFFALPNSMATKSHPKISFKNHVAELITTAKSYYRILMTVGVGQLFAQMVRTGRGTLIPLYGADILGLDIAQIGLISSLAAGIDMLLFYPVGIIMDRFGRKFAVVPSFITQGIGLMLIPLTGNFFGLAVVAGLIGFGNGLGSGTMMTLGADLAPEEARGEFLGMWRLIGDTGSMVGPVIAGAVAAVLALPSASVVMGFSGVVGSAIFLFLVPETARRAEV